MKTICLSLLLFIWFILTFILAISIVGWILIHPRPNFTGYYKPLSDVRSTWMTIGIDLKNTLLK